VTALISLANLSKVWPVRGGTPLVAVDGLTFDVSAGEIFGLLGPNGAGKTTTLRMLATLTRPTFGAARICGIDVLSDSEQVRHHIGYLSATSGLPRRLSCRQVLRLFADLHGVSDRRRAVEDALNRFGVAEFAERRVDALSTGMRQRLRIAATTLHKPRVLLLDEPALGLDAVAAHDLLMHVRDARDGGAAIILSTHILEDAERLCDRIGVIDEGCLHACGTPSALIAQAGTTDLRSAFLRLVRPEEA